MKIAFVLPDFRGGGAENVIISLANNINCRNDFQVFLLVGKDFGPLKTKISTGIKIIELSSRSGIKSAFTIKKICSNYAFDCVIGTLGMAHSVALSNLLGCRAFCISRIGNTVSEDLKRWKGIKKMIMFFYQNTLIFSDAIVTQSKYMHNDLLKNVKLLNTLNKKIYQIYNPIDRFHVYQKALEDIGEIISSKDIVTVGRLDRQKDISTILKAFSLYNKDYPSRKLHILGDGVERQKLENKCIDLAIENEVIFHGYVKNPYPYIKKAGVFVMASLYEGFSNAILEAAALEKKIIVTDCPGGNSEIIIHNVNGKLYPVGDYKTLYDQLKSVESFVPSFYNLDKFDLNNITDSYLSIICNNERIK